jgi:hypothetical protein
LTRDKSRPLFPDFEDAFSEESKKDKRVKEMDFVGHNNSQTQADVVFGTVDDKEKK